jgi:hypothetical protein
VRWAPLLFHSWDMPLVELQELVMALCLGPGMPHVSLLVRKQLIQVVVRGLRSETSLKGHRFLCKISRRSMGQEGFRC